MKEEEFLSHAQACVKELTTAIVTEIGSIAGEPVPSEAEAIDRLETDAFAAVVLATKVWLRLRLGRVALEAERRKAQS